MNLDELQSVRDRERQTDKLQQLRESFYTDAGEFIRQLQTERKRAAERADDPFDSPQVKQLTDEINTAEQTVEAIYEKRIGKIVKAASLDAAGLPSEADGLTTEEQELFETLVADIKTHRTRVLDVLDGEESDDPNGSNENPKPASSPGTEGVSAADVMGSGEREQQNSTAPADPEIQERPETRPQQDPSGRRTSPPANPEPGVETPPTNSDPGKRLANQQPEGSSDHSEQQPHAGPFEESPPEVREELQAAEPPVRNDGGQNTAAVTGVDAATGTKVDATKTDSMLGTDATTGVEMATETETDATRGAKADATTSDATTTGEETRDIERETILVTDDVGTFVGLDGRNYDLEANDVVTLPATNADPLVKQDVARQLE